MHSKVNKSRQVIDILIAIIKTQGLVKRLFYIMLGSCTSQALTVTLQQVELLLNAAKLILCCLLVAHIFCTLIRWVYVLILDGHLYFLLHYYQLYYWSGIKNRSVKNPTLS